MECSLKGMRWIKSLSLKRIRYRQIAEVIALISAGVVAIFLVWHGKNYWIVLPAATGFMISLRSLLLKPREKAMSMRELMRRAIRNKIVLATFLALLLAYFILYYLVPAYLMPIINEAKKSELKELVEKIVNTASNDADKARKICEWVYAHIVNVYREYKLDNYVVLLAKPPFICLRMRGEDYPLWPLASRCGACMEYSLLYRELAAAANLTVRSVHNPGEDHSWDEVLVDGQWIIVDPSRGRFNVSPSEFEEGRRLNVSYVYAKYPNGTMVNVTERYTGTGTLEILVVQDNGKRVEGAIIEVYSLNWLSNGVLIRGLKCLTGPGGLCTIRLGGGSYRVKAIRVEGWLLYSDEILIELSEGTNRTVTLTLRRDLLHAYIAVPQQLAYALMDFIVAPFIGLLILLILHICVNIAVILLSSTEPAKV